MSLFICSQDIIYGITYHYYISEQAGLIIALPVSYYAFTFVGVCYK